MWLDVTGTTCQQNTINLVDEFIDREVVCEDGNNQRDRVRGLGYGFEVFLARHVKRMWLEDPPVCRHTDNRLWTHGVSVSGRRIRLPAPQAKHYIQNDSADQ